ncbi:MAG: hypothetical protein HQK59_04945 [Deltaproteobacteria bacterium]|nr:hypothetical protein [Deltaproteobacteria bacterium]
MRKTLIISLFVFVSVVIGGAVWVAPFEFFDRLREVLPVPDLVRGLLPATWQRDKPGIPPMTSHGPTNSNPSKGKGIKSVTGSSATSSPDYTYSELRERSKDLEKKEEELAEKEARLNKVKWDLEAKLEHLTQMQRILERDVDRRR